jgi:hypothetical protein
MSTAKGPRSSQPRRLYKFSPPRRTYDPDHKKLSLCPASVAHWKNDEIVEEKLFYDLVGLLKQLGVTLTTKTQAEKVPAV